MTSFPDPCWTARAARATSPPRCARGGRATSVDPCYATPAPALAELVRRELDRVTAWTSSQPGRFPLDDAGVWLHASAWQTAARTFLTDYALDRDHGTGHYQAAALPGLPFPGGTFSVALCGFLLFTYPRHFDLDFHLRAIDELLRVAREVRLHPLNDSAGNPYPYLTQFLSELQTRNVDYQLLEVRGQSDPRDTLTLRLTRS
ncbi:hypothetical protein ACIBCO_39620 [Streptomyces violascens]|uniref:hypothetical protein n=1 Tax=Streptomyces violascens TaxID=67381 RepID=UPI003794888F